jgi:hypothetical protein
MNQIETEMPITEVIAYPSQAMIVRSKCLSFVKGENKIRITKLPESLSLETVRIETSAGKEITIIDISVEDSFIDSYDENKYRTMKSELDSFVLERQKLDALYQTYNEEFLLFLDKESLVESVKKDSFRSINVKNWSEFFSFLESQLGANRRKARETVFKWLDLNRKIDSAQQNLAQLESYDRVREHSVNVTVRCEKDLEETAYLKYMADSISWYPAYSVRADIDKKVLEISIHAMVSQATGEDWKDISLLLSTAIPLSSCDLPELKSQRIKEKDAEPVYLPGMARSANHSDVPEEESAMSADYYMEKKLDMREESKQEDSTGRMRRRESAKKEKGKMYAPASPKSVSVSQMTGGAANARRSVTNEVLQPASEIQKDGFFGETSSITGLVREVEKKVFSSIPVSEFTGYYADYDFFVRDRFVPENSIPVDEDVKVNPAFVSGVSPLESIGGFDYRYKVGGKVDSLRSSSTPCQIGVDIARCPIELDYVTIPVANEAVYLKASFLNTYDNPLPQGPAQVFAGDNFLGNIMFPTVGMNEKSSLSLGIDRDIKVIRREKSERKTGGFVKKELATECSVEIELASFKDKAVIVDVYDRIPISGKPKEVEIVNEKYSIEPLLVTERKIVIFRVTLAPGEKKMISISYVIKHPEDFRLTSTYANHPHVDSEGGAR